MINATLSESEEFLSDVDPTTFHILYMIMLIMIF